MKKSKRILAAVLALALVLVLAACGKSSVKDTAYDFWEPPRRWTARGEPLSMPMMLPIRP